MVLVSPKHGGNVGAAARAMKNFGLAQLYLVAPRCRIGAEARAMAAHAGDVLDAAVVVGDLDEAIADRTVVIGTSARRRASGVHAASEPETLLPRLVGARGAIVFGPEDTGLDNDALDRCQGVVTLPTAAYASLNLAQSVVVLAYLWFRGAAPAYLGEGARGPVAGAPPDPAADAPDPAPDPRSAPAPRGQVEAMLEQLADVALDTGYTDERRLVSALRPLRSVFDRAGLSVDEVARLRGLWSQIAWALGRPDDRAT